MNVKIVDISKRLRKEDIHECLLKNTNQISSEWIFHQWNWLHQNYKPFKDLLKYLIVVSLKKKSLEFYFENGISYSYNEFYSYPKIPIDNFSFSELNKDFNLPKETLRRKVLELEKLGVIKKEKRKVFIDRSSYDFIKPIDQIKITSKYISKVSKILLKNKLIDKIITEEEIRKKIMKEFSKVWLWFLSSQLNIMTNYMKFLEKDLNILYIWATCLLNQVYNHDNKFKSKDIHSIIFDDYTKAIINQSAAGLNTMSISEMTGLPRATVIRKLKLLEKNRLLTSSSKKQFYLPNPSTQMSSLIKNNFRFKSEFIAKTLNLIIV
jgi:DNA-binding Lrp family transcriptional regulator